MTGPNGGGVLFCVGILNNTSDVLVATLTQRTAAVFVARVCRLLRTVIASLAFAVDVDVGVGVSVGVGGVCGKCAVQGV